MHVLFYIFVMCSKGSRRDGQVSIINGVLAACLFLLPLVLTILNIFNIHVVNFNAILANCCSMGAVNPKNPFSSKAVMFTYVSVPLLSSIGYALYKNAKNIFKVMDGIYTLPKSNGHVIIIDWLLVLITPLGAQGDGLRPWIVLGLWLSVILGIYVFLQCIKIRR